MRVHMCDHWRMPATIVFFTDSYFWDGKCSKMSRSRGHYWQRKNNYYEDSVALYGPPVSRPQILITLSSPTWVESVCTVSCDDISVGLSRKNTVIYQVGSWIWPPMVSLEPPCKCATKDSLIRAPEAANTTPNQICNISGYPSWTWSPLVSL
jgi:hypothetical protein